MIALDTNVLARFYIEPKNAEDEKQRPVVARLLHGSKSLFVSTSVMLELEWVLRGGYGFGPEAIKNAFEHLVCLPNITIENHDAMLEALSHFGGGLDFADAVHVASAKRCGAFSTFDRKLIKNAGRLGIHPPCTGPG